jgi:uracil-DNA glycosylase family 4
VRQEIAKLEADLALCERCFGPERRFALRLRRPLVAPRVLLLAERPPRSLLSRETRLGLDNQDPSARFLAAVVAEAGIPEDDVLFAAAVMCRPASRRLEAAAGGACLEQCAVHVRELVRVVEPALIVPLGKAALRSLRFSFPDRPEIADLRFPESVGRTTISDRFAVHPLYHVTPRARLRRREEQQREDWRGLGRVYRDLPRPAATSG